MQNETSGYDPPSYIESKNSSDQGQSYNHEQPIVHYRDSRSERQTNKNPPEIQVNNYLHRQLTPAPMLSASNTQSITDRREDFHTRQASLSQTHSNRF